MPAPYDETMSCYFSLARPLAKLKRLLTTIQQTANNISPEVCAMCTLSFNDRRISTSIAQGRA